jgi:hypothetical protein
MLGFDVLHIQAEGGVEAARRKYNQIWTRLPHHNIKNGNLSDISELKMNKINRTLNNMRKMKRDIFIYSFDKFGQGTVIDIRQKAIEFKKVVGKYPDLIVVDSLNLVATGVSKKLDTDPSFLKHKLKKVAEMLTDLAVELNSRVLTVTQARDIPKEKTEDPSFHITRDFTEGDRTLVQPFSYVFSGNRTDHETEINEMRLYIDKLRHYGIKQRSVRISTNYDKGMFYDRAKTNKKAKKEDEV